MTTQKVDIFKNQTGAALVIALIMIIVMTLIVLAASFTSNFEIKLAGNKRGSTDAFYAADSGVQVVMNKAENFDLPGKYDVGDQYYFSRDAANMNPTNADIIIYHNTAQSGAPRGFGFSATGNYGFVHYLITAAGKDQIDLNPMRSTTTIQQKVVRLVPGGN
jgi:hypothetical protein